ncbi:hypothetical protein BGX26_005630 [Mortierella sp. AD094]|nr:hypothetical protein BGX26_005630 [Mortierella sp. AD094]
MVPVFLDQETSKTDNNFYSSKWGPEAADTMCKEISDCSVVRDMKMVELIDAALKEVICKVVVEENLFETWTYGRTVLIGDFKSEDVEKALKAYKDELYPPGNVAVETSTNMFNIIKQGLMGK